MRNFSRILLAVSLSAAAFAIAADKVAIAALLKDVDKYDGKVITLTGKVAKFKAKTSKAGNAYYNFKLAGKADEDVVSIYGQGKLEKEPEDGATVEVTGKFAKETKVGANTFKNELNITKKEGDEKTKDFGIKVVKASAGG